MELRHLRYFVAVAEHGGVRHAAERLNVAQPAITRQIKDLEAELGFDLLRRQGRGVVLTDAGRAYLEDARRILAHVADAGSRARQVAEGKAGTLRIGLLENASWAGIAPAALSRFSRQHPAIVLDVRPMTSLQQIQSLADGELDGAFAYRQVGLESAAVASRHLRTDDVMLAASRDLVFDHDGDLSLEDIDGLPMVGFPREVAPGYYDRLHGAMAEIGLRPDIVQWARDETTILSLVSAGVGCAFVNSANIGRPPRNVQFRRVLGVSVPIEFHFHYRVPTGTLTAPFLAVVETELAAMAQDRGSSTDIDW